MDALAAVTGLAALLLLHGVPLAVAARLVRARSVELGVAQAILVWAAFEVLLASVLGAMGAFRLVPMLAVTLGCAALARIVVKPAPRPLQLVRWPRRVLPRLLCGAVLVLAVAVLAKALLRPPLEWDSLSYHLPRAAHWVREGTLSLVPLPDAMDNYNHFPWNGEVLAATLLLASHDDTWVGLLNVPFVILLVAALAALAKELGARPTERRLLALVAGTVPVLLSQAHTAHVEVQIAAEVAAAALFVVRATRGRGPADAGFAGLALGFAVGTKLTALVPAALLVGTLALAAWRGSPRPFALGAGLLAAATLAAPRYLLNLLGTGNPLYPIALRLGPLELAGSPFDVRALAAATPVSGRDLDALLSLLPWQTGTAPGFGPLLLLFVPCALWSLGTLGAGVGGVRRLVVFGLCASWALPLVGYFLSSAPSAVRLRRGFPADTPRYLAALLPLVVASATIACARLRAVRARLVLRGFLLALLAGNLLAFDRAWRAPVAEVGCAALALALLLALLRGTHALRILALLGVLAAAPGLVHLRTAWRSAYWQWQEQHVVGSLPPLAEAWRICDASVPRTIAYAVGRQVGVGYWFSYPLLGSRLQNRVLFALPDRVGSYDPRRDAGRLGTGADFAAWRANLVREKVDLVFLQQPLGQEHEFLVRHPDAFELVDAGPAHALVRLR